MRKIMRNEHEMLELIVNTAGKTVGFWSTPKWTSCNRTRCPFRLIRWMCRDQFVVGGKAWQLCRTRQADPDTFGIFDMHGLWFVRGHFVRDVASLNKVELLRWDSWGIIEAHDEDLSDDDLVFLDQVAEQTSGDVPDFGRVQAWYENDDRLHVPATFRSYGQVGVQTVVLAQV
jgi:hypothetical protein